jgi:hypothetical protein
MNIKKLSSFLLVTGGFIELVIAILHFIWPFNFIQLPDFNNVTSSIRDFILLASLAIGLCMTIFAYLSFYFSKRIMFGEKSALIFSLSQGILWIFRLIFEILLPVRVPLYSIGSPSDIIIIGVIFIILIYLIPVFLLRRIIITK